MGEMVVQLHATETFWAYRIANFFLISYICSFMPCRFKKWVTATIAILFYLATWQIDLIGVMGNETDSNTIVMELLEIIIFQVFVFFICKYRDSRALFWSMSAATYICAGDLTWYAVRILTNSQPVAYACQIIMNFAVMLLLWKTVRATLLEEMENRDTNWVGGGVVFALIYGLVYSMTVYPVNVFKVPEILPANILTMVIVISYCVLLGQAVQTMRETEAIKHNQEQIQNYVDRLKWESERIAQNERENAIARHDLKHYVAILQGYLEAEEYDRIREMLGQLNNRFEGLKPKRLCENISISALLGFYEKEAANKQIKLEMDVHVPAKIGINEYEYAATIANLIDNAMRAAEKVSKPEERYVHIKTAQNRKQLIFEIRNSYAEKIEVTKEGLIQTTSQGDGHGYGMKSVRTFAENNGGVFDYSADGKEFVSRIMVQI